MATLSKARLRYLMPIELIKFLKKEKALCAFMNTFIDTYSKLSMNPSEEYIIRLFKSSDAIIGSFVWIKYPHKISGTYYWSKLHTKWRDYLNNK